MRHIGWKCWSIQMEPQTRTYTTDYPITPAEFERLYMFRQAVLAGFYSDELPDEPESPVSAAADALDAAPDTAANSGANSGAN
jgi:hypothetical protein